MSSTLPPTPSYNPNIPIITSAGGTSIAYKDPNSPESILKKTTELAAQSNVDTQYDVNRSPYKQGFTNYPANDSVFSLLFKVFLVLGVVFVLYKALKLVLKGVLIVLAVVFLIIVIKRVTRTA
jgi:uncharacterized membrane protein